MKRLTILLLIAITFISCSNDKQNISQNIKEKVQNMTDSDVVNELIIKSDGDKEQLGRILKCSTFTLDRVKNKETYLTENSRKEFESLLLDIEFNGDEVLVDRDPYYDSWIRSFRSWLNKYVKWAIAGFIIFFIIGLSDGDAGFAGFVDVFITIVFGGGYLITWIGNMVSPYETPAFLFVEKINPIFEALL